MGQTAHDAGTLQKAAAFLADARAIRANPRVVEAQVRSTFTSHLPSMFPDVPYWVRRHIADTETTLRVAAGAAMRTVFVDNLVDYTAIEYETNLKDPTRFAEGKGQVAEFCAGLINAGAPPDQVLGVLSDTLEWHAYRVQVMPGAVVGQLSETDVVLDEIDSLDVTSPQQGEARRLLDFLTKHLARLSSRPISPETIASDLGFESPFAASRIAAIGAVVRRGFAQEPAYAQMIVGLWNNFAGTLNTAANAAGFDLETYVAEFYLVTLAKLLCANALAGEALESGRTELRSILNGDFFRQRRLENIVEYDYFGWLNRDPFVDAVADVAALIQRDLLAYDFEAVPEDRDIFGPLMAQVAARTQRLLLGQEWTPGWLAGAMAKKLIAMLPPGEVPRFVDMCCGSGAMIANVLREAEKLLSQSESDDPDLALARLSQAITGFDIDPLAVVMARITWLLTNRRHLVRASVPVTIPIYHADSLFLVTPLGRVSVAQRGGTHSLDLDGKTVEVPEWLLQPEHQQLFDEVLQQAYALGVDASRLARQQPGTPPDAASIARSLSTWRAGAALPAADQAALQEAVARLATRVAELDLADRNGIWTFILRNSYRPSLVLGNFNGLISNPPWLAMSKIADNPYRGAVTALAQQYGIRPAGSTFPHLDLSTVFLMHSVQRYLAPGAVIGCVVPQTVVNGHHHTRFRQMTGPDGAHEVALAEIWEVGKGTFKNRAAVLFGRKGPAERTAATLQGLAVDPGVADPVQWHWRRMGTRAIWSQTGGSARPEVGFYKPAPFEQGADILPRRLFFVEELERRGDLVHVRSIDRTNPVWGFAVADAKAPFDKFALAGDPWVHERFVFLTALSKHLAPYHLALARLVPTVAPIRRGADGSWETLPSAEAVARDRASLPVFEQMHQEIRTKKADSSRRDLWAGFLNYRNKLRRQVLRQEGFLVLTGAGGDRLCAAYAAVGPATDSDRLLIDQTLYWAVVPAEEEALYLTGLFNSEAIYDVLREFVPRGKFGGRHQHTLPFGVTPEYDEDNPVHADVVAATRALQDEFVAKRAALRASRDVFDPAVPLAWRRSRIREFVATLDAYPEYDRACRALYDV